MAWVVENVASVPNTSNTVTGKFQGPQGYCILTGWLQGFGLNALEQMSSLGSYRAEEWPEFRDTLKATTTSLKQSGQWITRRWMFTITEGQRAYPGGLLGELIKASRLVDSFPNWSHGGVTIHMYFLEFK